MEALAEGGYPNPTYAQKMNALFFCDGGINGEIALMTMCPREVCFDGGWGNDDYCQYDDRIFLKQSGRGGPKVGA